MPWNWGGSRFHKGRRPVRDHLVRKHRRHKLSTPNPMDTNFKILALDLGKFNTVCCFFDSKT